MIALDRILITPVLFPFDYGFIPGTWSRSDDDPLDVMCVLPIATFPGCLLDVRVVGMYRMVDTGQEDHKVLAISAGDETFADVDDIADMPSLYLKRIEFFWKNYTKLAPGRSTEGKGWSGKSEAVSFIDEGINYYKEKFSAQN